MTEKLKVIILASNRLPVVPQSIELDNKKKNTTLDWIIKCIKPFDVKKISVVIGPNQKNIEQKNYKKIIFIKNQYWNNFGNLFSLSLAFEQSNLKSLISYGDIIFNQEALNKLLSFSEFDFVIGYDSSWENRYANRSDLSLKKVELISEKKSFLKTISKGFSSNETNDGEFCGLFLVSSKGTKIISEILNKKTTKNKILDIKSSSILDLLNYLIHLNYKIKVVDISGGWSEMDAINDFKSFVFRGKADTLASLENNIKNAEILPQINFSIDDWQKSKNSITKKIINKKWKFIVVRSSGLEEDSLNSSMAGQYTSFLNIPDNKNNIIDSIENVISVIIKKSKFRSDLRNKSKVLIQPFLRDTSLNGVAFSCDIKNASPYFLINYDNNNDTEGVTSGTSKTQKITYISRFYKSMSDIPVDLRKIINLILELEKTTGALIDIEFGIKNQKLYLFQVRPLILENKNDKFLNKLIHSEVNSIKTLLPKLFKTQKSVFGTSNVFSDMTDWNPAEMIGLYPKPLSISLYQYLITNKTWAKARKKIGYKDLSSQKLMILLAGHPYINVRNSFNSLIPFGIENELSNKLVNYYIKKLKRFPFLHDKIEFDIVFSCYTPKTDQDLLNLEGKVFSKKDIYHLASSLKKLTINLLENPKLSIAKQLKEVKNLESKYKDIIKNPENFDLYSILKICIKHGTLPFAILARYAFIASKIFKDIKEIGLISDQNINKFFTSIETIAGENSRMFEKVQNGSVSINNFLKKFGHLRPGTYDLLQQRYDKAPEKYFKTSKKNNITNNFNKKIKISYKKIFDKEELLSIQNYLNSLSKNLSTDDFIKFTVEAIKGREYAKFQFTKIISHLLEYIKEFGENQNIEPEDLVFLTVEDILKYSSKKNQHISKKLFLKKMEIRKDKYKIYKQIKLPSFIKSTKDVSFFTFFYDKPNFITNKIITCESIYIKNMEQNLFIHDKIVLIDNADPGFDWIFTHNIRGLITKFGGVASHMSIRCNEFNLPAAIGCGELLFERLINKKLITLDCESEMLKDH